MSKIEKLRKRPVEVETMLWDGTDERASELQEWTGKTPAREWVFLPVYQLPSDRKHAELWVAHNSSWTPLPVGYRVAKELDGSGFYPLSPEGAAAGYEMPGAAELAADRKAPDGAPWYAHLDGPCGPECARTAGGGSTDG
jgi:hypothetical protein